MALAYLTAERTVGDRQDSMSGDAARRGCAENAPFGEVETYRRNDAAAEKRAKAAAVAATALGSAL